MSDRRPNDPGADAAPPESREARPPRPYQAPRITRKRPVARATLFSGSGPDSGGVVSA